jgi:hypothetical protein
VKCNSSNWLRYAIDDTAFFASLAREGDERPARVVVILNRQALQILNRVIWEDECGVAIPLVPEYIAERPSAQDTLRHIGTTIAFQYGVGGQA